MISASASLTRLLALAFTTVLGLLQVLFTLKLLSPEEVGAYGFALLLAQPFTDSVLTGITWAIYRDPNASNDKVQGLATVFVLMGALNGLAFFVAHSLLRDGLHTLAATMALVVALSSAEGVLSGLASRNLQFVEMSVAGMVGILCNVVVSWTAASATLGAWSLALGSLAGLVAKAGLMQALNRDKLRFVLPERIADVAPDLKFAGWTSLFKTTSNVARNGLGWAITLLEGDHMLGLFNRAQRIAGVPGDIFVMGFGGMAGPSLAKSVGNRDALNRHFVLFLSFAVLACGGLTLLAWGASYYVLPLIATGHWEGAILISSVLFWIGLFRGVLRITDDYLRLSGTVSSQVGISIANGLVLGASLYLAHQLGVGLRGYAVVALACNAIFALLLGWMCARAMEIPLLDLIGKLMGASGSLGQGCTLGIVSVALAALINGPSWGLALISIGLGCASCLAAWTLYKDSIQERHALAEAE